MSKKEIVLPKAVAEEFELVNWPYETSIGTSPKYGRFNLENMSLFNARNLHVKGFPYLKKKEVAEEAAASSPKGAAKKP